MMYTYNNGTAALKMPSRYVPITEEEMEYISGGASNNSYQKDQQKKLRIEMSKLSSAQKKALEKQVYKYQKGYVTLALAGVDGIIYGLSTLGKLLLLDQAASWLLDS